MLHLSGQAKNAAPQTVEGYMDLAWKLVGPTMNKILTQTRDSTVLFFFLLMSAALPCPQAKESTPQTVEQYMDWAWKLVGPMLNNLGFSGLVGIAAAAALKFVGKALAVLVGLSFAMVQGLAYAGLITVNW